MENKFKFLSQARQKPFGIGRRKFLAALLLLKTHIQFFLLSLLTDHVYSPTILVVDARRIGHLIWQTEGALNFVSSQPAGKMQILIWGPECNRFVASALKRRAADHGVRVLHTKVSKLGDCLGDWNQTLFGLPQFAMAPTPESFVPTRRPLAGMSSKLATSCVNFLAAKGIDVDEPFICVHNRTAQYLLDQVPSEDSSHNSFRNFPIADCENAIRSFVSSGYQVIRVGRSADDPLMASLDGVLDLTQVTDYPSALDQYVGLHAAFYFGADSGGAEFSAVSRTPISFVNNTSFKYLAQRRSPAALPFVPQTTQCVLCSRPLSFLQTVHAGLGNVGKQEHLKRALVEMRPASKVEIGRLAEQCLALIQKCGAKYDEMSRHLDATMCDVNLEFQSQLQKVFTLKTRPRVYLGEAFLDSHTYWVSGQSSAVCACRLRNM